MGRSRSPLARKDDWSSNASAAWSNDGDRSSRTNNRDSGGHRDDDRRRGDPQPAQTPRESRDARDGGRDSRNQALTWDYRDNANSKRESRDAKDGGREAGEHTWDFRES